MRFNNWNLEIDTFPVRQYDNLTRRLEVSGDIPDGWSWVALLSIGDNLNIISLQYGEPGLYVDLTADMIPYAGKYNLQLKATQGEKVRHTNIVSMTVNESMSGDVQWPELPSAFSQAVEQAQEAANTAKEAALQYPKIIDGYWWVYDANSGKFVNSGIYAGGSSPYIGQNGNWFVGDEDTGIAATGQQGWSVSAAALDEDGALVLTIRNPADGSTQTLLPVAIDNSAALQAVAEAITAQGTTQVQRVETAGSTAVEEVSTAKDAALQAVQTAQGSATTAIGEAQTAAVEAVEAKGEQVAGEINNIVPAPTPEDAGKALVVNADGTGLEYGNTGEWVSLYDGTVEEEVMELRIDAVNPVKCVEIYAETPEDDGDYSLQCYLDIDMAHQSNNAFGIGTIFNTTKNTGIVRLWYDSTYGGYICANVKTLRNWYQIDPNVGLTIITTFTRREYRVIRITKNKYGKTYPMPIGTKLRVWVMYE